MSKKIVIQANCNGCGLCLDSQFIEELPDGKVKVRGTGIVSSEKEEIAEKLKEVCPVQAIVIQEKVSKSKEEIIKLAEKKLGDFKIEMPDKSEFAFEEKYMVFSFPAGVSGEYNYKYNSYSSARSAARNAIKSIFDSRKNMIRNMVNNYRSDKLSKYYEYAENESNFYFKANREAQKVLDSIIEEIQIYNPTVPLSIEDINISSRPNRNMVGIDGIKESFLYCANGIYDSFASDSCYSLDSYIEYCEIDDMEETTIGAFGRTKCVTKYGFYGAYKVFHEMEEDIRSNMKYSVNEYVVDKAYDWIGIIVKTYSDMLKAELNKKIVKLKELM